MKNNSLKQAPKKALRKTDVMRSACSWCGQKRKLNKNKSCKCCSCLDERQADA